MGRTTRSCSVSQGLNLNSVCSSDHEAIKPQAERSACSRGGSEPRGGFNLVPYFPRKPCWEAANHTPSWNVRDSHCPLHDNLPNPVINGMNDVLVLAGKGPRCTKARCFMFWVGGQG